MIVTHISSRFNDNYLDRYLYVLDGSVIVVEVLLLIGGFKYLGGYRVE